jgi:HrpA-like RNA helicase
LLSPKVLSALENLRRLGAIDYSGIITPLGKLFVTLPLEPHLAKLVVYACIFRCLDPILVIVVSLSLRSPFLSPPTIERKDLLEIRRNFVSGMYSDHLSLLRTYSEFVLRLSVSREEVC